MKPNGELAKSWLLDGSVGSPHGSVGCFFVLPLFDAYEVTGDKKYLDTALKGLDFYLGEFNKGGCTTAGALDSNCIDKESGAPVLRAAMKAYEVTGQQKYLDASIELAYYLATWQYHYSVQFPADSQLAQLKVDTYGSTAVSAAHNALDHYGIYYIPEYLKLAELTGNDIWRQRARAIWYNGTQMPPMAHCWFAAECVQPVLRMNPSVIPAGAVLITSCMSPANGAPYGRVRSAM